MSDLTVITPAPYRRLVSPGMIFAELDFGEDDLQVVLRLIEQASRMIEDYCGRVLLSERVTERFRDAEARQMLWLERTPVTQVHAVTDANGTAVSVSDYELKNVNQLRLRSSWVPIWSATEVGLIEITVEYTGGYVPAGWAGPTKTMPAAIERACIDLVRNLHQDRERVGITSESIGDYRVSYASSREDVALPVEISTALDRYRRPVVL